MWLGLLFLFFLFTRIWPYFQNSVPLGYDPGLYLYLFKEYNLLHFWEFGKLADWLFEMFPPGLPITAKILMVFAGPDQLLIPLIIFSQILLFLSVFLLAQKLWNQKTALWSIFIFATSAIQFKFYWYYYLKNSFALSFLLFTIYYLLSRSYWAIPFTILVFYFHQQTAVFLFAILLLLIVLKKDQRRFLTIVLGSSLIASTPYYLFSFNQSLLPLMQPVLAGFLPQALGGTMGLASGSFYNLLRSLFFALPYLPFGILGLYLVRKDKKALILIVPFVLSLLIIIFGFFFSRRFIPFTDLFLIIPAGYGVVKFFQKRQFLRISYVLILVLFTLFFIFQTGKPLIFNDELIEITRLAQTEKESYILVTDQAYTPWIYGWSDRKPIAPAFGEYDIYWTREEWHKFWESNNREIEKNLLLRLPKPLYIYNGDRRQQILTDFSGECFERINWRTYKFICEDR